MIGLDDAPLVETCHFLFNWFRCDYHPRPLNTRGQYFAALSLRPAENCMIIHNMGFMPVHEQLYAAGVQKCTVIGTTLHKNSKSLQYMRVHVV